MNSRVPVSTQAGPHRDVVSVVRRHLAEPWRRPIARHTREAFESVRTWLQGDIILDSCCGTGESTRQLASRHPSMRVLGIDKSADRLSRHGDVSLSNYRLVRADVNDLWRLLAEQGITVARHCLFYPNPYPKSSQLRKRWHGSPAFPSLIALGGSLEVRSNWRIYLEEFAIALQTAGFASTITDLDEASTPISRFEAKYRASAQPLHALNATLTP